MIPVEKEEIHSGVDNEARYKAIYKSNNTINHE